MLLRRIHPIALHCHRRIFISSPNCSSFEKFKKFITQTDVETFDVENVKSAHKWDDIDENNYTLIYKDIGATRTFFMTALFVPCFFTAATIFLYDIVNKKPQDRFEFVQRIVKDAEELGVLLCLPSVALVIVISTLVRMQQLRLLRIYQNKKNVDEYIGIRSNYLVGQEKYKFHRQSSVGIYYDEEQTEGIRVILNIFFGNIQVGNNRFMVIDEMFKANNYRTYMLNETSIPPRL